MAERLTHADGRMTSDDVARRVLRAIERKHFYAFVPTMADLIWRLKRLMPVVAVKIVARYMCNKAAALAAEAQKHERANPTLAHPATPAAADPTAEASTSDTQSLQA